MKKLSVIALTLAISPLSTFAQNEETISSSSPAINLEKKPPALLIKKNGNSSPLRVSHLDIETTVTGNTAETTMTMTFVNDTARILEGELVFPLDEGVTVSGYALDVNGKMREGVVVEKAAARAAYEEVIRQKIDPGLVEWTKGNNFRTRIYPIPANGTKKVSISFEQTLADSNKGLRYNLPFAFTEKIDQFAFKLKVVKPTGRQQIIIENNAGLNLKLQEKSQWTLEASQKNFLPGKSLDLEIPKESIQQQTVFQSADGTKYFYLVDTQIKPQKTLARKAPNKLKIIWDASNSGLKRDHNKEITLLKRYITQPGIQSIDLEILRNDITPAGSYTSDTIDQLILKLTNLRYDGATRLGLLNLSDPKYNAILLISDGIMTLGQQQPTTDKTPVFTFHASQSAEHALLRSISIKTNGAYANLINLDENQAYNQLTSETFKLMSINGKGINQTFPNIPTSVTGTTSVTGIITADKPTTVILNYGNQNNISKKHSFVIDPTTITQSATNIPRIWAQKQLAELELQPELNQKKITNLAKSHGIVTRYTSLLVLDRIQDYVRYRIMPPATEPAMQQEYKTLLKTAPDPNTSNKEFLTNLAKKWKEMVTWHQAKPADLHPLAQKRVNNLFERIAPMEKNINLLLSKKELTKEQQAYLDFKLKHIASLKAEKVKLSKQEFTKDELLKQHLRILQTYQNTPSKTYSSENIPIPKLDLGDGFDFGGGWNTLEGNAAVTRGRAFSLDGDVTLNSSSSLSEIRAFSNGASLPLQDRDKKPQKGNALDSTIASDRRKAKIKLNKWDPNTPYLKELRAAQKEIKTTTQLENLYFKQKKNYTKSSAFYLDVAQFFLQLKEEKIALRILSNVAELDMENPALLRILGHRYDQLEQYELATFIFREVLTLREEEPQSYRDLALVLEKQSVKTGDNNLLQESADLLWLVSSRKWDNRMHNLQLITLTELNALIARNTDKVKVSSYDTRFIHNLDCDMRIVLTWDADNTDIDLWVTDILGEKCFYGHSHTESHGRMSDDLTQGYGPEVFMIKKALPGAYKIQANYYGNRQQTLAGETTIQATIYTNYGRPNEKRQAITLRLKDVSKIINIGEASFKK